MIERIIKSTEAKGKWNKMQCRFIKDRSCHTRLIPVFDKITHFLDKGNAGDLSYLDFNKAFEVVPHRRLLMKLEKTAISRGIVR